MTPSCDYLEWVTTHPTPSAPLQDGNIPVASKKKQKEDGYIKKETKIKLM
jgi:hypothetical protein